MRWRDPSLGLALLVLAAALPAAARVAGPIDVSQPWAAPAAAGADTGVMMVLRNEGDVRDDLVRAACAGAESAELVEPAQPGRPVQRIDGIPVQPHSTITLTPGGIHLVLLHLQKPAELGTTLHCTATFAKTGERLFEATVRNDAPPVLPPT